MSEEVSPQEEAVHMATMSSLLRTIHRDEGPFEGCDVVEMEDGHQVIITGKVDVGVLAYDVIAVAIWLHNFHEDFLQTLSTDFFDQREQQ